MKDFERIPGGKIHEPPPARREITDGDRKRFAVIEGGKSAAPESRPPKIQVVENAEIREGVIFSREWILGIIRKIAAQEGIDRKLLTVAHEKYDARGNLLALLVEVNFVKARTMGLKGVFYDYLIKGNYDRAFSDETCVIRIYEAEDPEASRGGIVARYQGGRWQLNPGHIAPSVKEINRDDPDPDSIA